MREAILWIHRWLGLTAGLIFGIASATGAVLVYQPELDRLLGGPRFETTEGAQQPAVIEEAVLSAYPDASITGIHWPDGGENVVRVDLTDGDGRARNIWVDNGSGRVVQPRDQLLVLVGIRRLHVNLLMGRFGRTVVTWTTAAALVAMVLGIYLWWPGIRKLWTGFRIRLKRGFYILNFDLHQALGILAMPLLIFGSATGVLIVYGGIVDEVENAVHGPPAPTSWGDLRSSVPADGQVAPVSAATMATTARAHVPEATLRLITVPAAADGPVEAELATPGGGTVRVALDRYTGEVLETQPGKPPFRFDRHTNEQLHVANIGGPLFAALYMLSCAVGFVLVPTGVVVWWLKRTRKADSAERRAEARVTREASAARQAG